MIVQIGDNSQEEKPYYYVLTYRGNTHQLTYPKVMGQWNKFVPREDRHIPEKFHTSITDGARYTAVQTLQLQ